MTEETMTLFLHSWGWCEPNAPSDGDMRAATPEETNAKLAQHRKEARRLLRRPTTRERRDRRWRENYRYLAVERDRLYRTGPSRKRSQLRFWTTQFHLADWVEDRLYGTVSLDGRDETSRRTAKMVLGEQVAAELANLVQRGG